MARFTAEHVRQAFAAIRRDGGKTEGFDRSRKWDIVDDETGDRFPPKAVLFRAKQLAEDTETYAGGGGDRGTNNALRKRGFSVILKPELETSQETNELEAILASNLDATSKKQLVNARLGQGSFRQQLIDLFGGKCALTGLGITAALRASHIKAWKDADNRERLDPYNGLLLAATVDALFDKHLISFTDNGELITDSSILPSTLDSIGIDATRRVKLAKESLSYLHHHRAVFQARRK